MVQSSIYYTAVFHVVEPLTVMSTVTINNVPLSHPNSTIKINVSHLFQLYTLRPSQ